MNALSASTVLKSLGMTAVFVGAASAASLALSGLKESRPAKPSRNAEAEVLYLPRGDFLSGISFGYKNALANVLWFNTLNYFGKHHKTDQNYQWLAHMCSLITQLKPQEIHFYEFCAHMLSWEAAQPEKAIQILNRAAQQHPQRWEFRYLRGFTYYFFLNDLESATSDFVAAAKLPGVHPIVTRLAAQKLMSTNSNASAIEFLESALNSTSDPNARGALESRLRELLVVRDLQLLDSALDVFSSRTDQKSSSLQELVTSGILSSIPIEPFGGEYRVNPETGWAESTSPQAKKLLARHKRGK